MHASTKAHVWAPSRTHTHPHSLVALTYVGVQTGQGQAVNRADQDKVFESLCLQMLQRTRPRMCPQGKRWHEAWEESRHGSRAAR